MIYIARIVFLIGAAAAFCGLILLALTLGRLEKRLNRSVHSVKQLLMLARLDPDAPLARRMSTASP